MATVTRLVARTNFYPADKTPKQTAPHNQEPASSTFFPQPNQALPSVSPSHHRKSKARFSPAWKPKVHPTRQKFASDVAGCRQLSNRTVSFEMHPQIPSDSQVHCLETEPATEPATTHNFRNNPLQRSSTFGLSRCRKTHRPQKKN